MKSTTRINLLVVCCVICIVAYAIYALYDFLSVGNNPHRTAEVLVLRNEYGRRAIPQAQSYGDAFFEPLREVSKDFQLINDLNAFSIAEVLASNRSVVADSLLQELSSRTNTWMKLIGVFGLISHGKYNAEVDNNNFLVQMVRANKNDSITRMSVRAMGVAKDSRYVPCLVEVLQGQSNQYWVHAAVCDALSSISDKRVIDVLKTCMQNSEFHATPEAFHALNSMGYHNAIPLAIQRLDPSEKRRASGRLLLELKMETGKDFGYDKKKWMDWWMTSNQGAAGSGL